MFGGHAFSATQEITLLFNSYVGAVYATQGMYVILNWIGALVDPDYVPAPQSDVDMDPLHNAKKFKMEQYNPALTATPEPMIPPPPPPVGPPPPLPMPPMMPNPLAPAQPNTAFLPLFNQTANQRRMFVEYPAQFSGPAHAGKWNVKCVGEQHRMSSLLRTHDTNLTSQSMVSRKALALAPASSLLRKRPPDRPILPWAGLRVRPNDLGLCIHAEAEAHARNITSMDSGSHICKVVVW